ncbi:MAG: hypothetical protein WAN65_23670 [Candidatus Sulfotelmatobacter sp.]
MLTRPAPGETLRPTPRMPRRAFVKRAGKGETPRANQPKTAPDAAFRGEGRKLAFYNRDSWKESNMTTEYATVSKFDRAVAGLQGGNNLAAKATTIEHVDPIIGEAETFIVQTIRDAEGDHVIVKFVDKDGVKRLILPPKVVSTIARQRDALTARSRSNVAKATAKARMDRGELPGFMKKAAA